MNVVMDCGQSQTGRLLLLACNYAHVAAHFNLFKALTDINKSATDEAVLAAYKDTIGDGNETSVPCATPVCFGNSELTIPERTDVELIQDALDTVSGLGLIDLGEDLYGANTLTHHSAESPSAVPGAIHLYITFNIAHIVE
ncbi:hypothetical protein BDW75DRAFT_240856 [Aspergillus navahoensis]